ncbi:GM20199 [Drosophila sechellia]|uniref:GM20199 n=1 Tax=Drosophila sechellia TaxID=7238 RepID=B4HRF4_DROSE|nr:GM20199 [Drosophila sechellia]
MEDIEYLDEYKDLVLPGIKSSAPPASAGVPRQRRISSDSSSSSSIDADIFQKLFHGKYLDDELLKEGSGSKSQDRRRRPPSSSSSDESNDALEALFCGKSSQSKLSKRRERYESFDSVDDLGEALMRPSHRLTVPKPSTSQAGSKKSQDAIPHRSISNSSSGNIAMSSGHTFASPKNKKTNSVTNKTAVSANGDKGTSSKNKTVTIVKPQKTDLRPSRLEPKTDPLTLGDLYGDSDSDSSYEYESDFYGDQDSDEEDEPVIDISTDTSRTTSVADTVTPVVSDDEGQEPQSELNQRPENDKESFLSSTYERLQSYLSNLSSAEAPPIYKKQNSARKSRSNEKKPSSFQQVKHANEQTAASDKEANKKERDLEPPEASSSAKSSASKASGSRKLYEIENNATLEAVERMSLDVAEQILKIDVERSYEFEKRSGSKSRSLSRSKILADSSISQMDHVRKLTYSSERLDQPEPLSTQLRRSKSESLPKRGRPRGQKQRKNRAATTEEKSPNVRDGEGEPVKRKRGRPRKIIPKEEPTTAETENPIEGLNTNVPLSIDTSKGNPETERVNLEVPTKQDEPISELDNAKELTGSTNLSQDDIKMPSSHQETDQKCAPDRVALDKSESAPKVEQEPDSKADTPTETFDTPLDESKVSESAKNHIKSEDKGLSSDKEKTQKESRNGNSKETNHNENSVIVTNEVVLPVDMAESKAVSGNILEESDSQLAEDFKLAEEILAAEVGKGVEANEVPVTSVQGEQNPVIEIVKELEQETISEVVPAQNENQSSVEDQTLADEENPVENQSPVKEPSSSKDEPPAEEHSPGPDQDPVVKQETPVAKNKQHDKEHNEASQAESLSGSDDPSSSGTLSKKRNHSSPANTPKKSKEIEALQSSVPRRALRSDKATPQNQRESRSKRTLKTELTLLMDDTMRRSSPRLGRSPAESHSSQERSPMEKKVTVSKLAKDLITIEKEKVIELKSLPDASETKDVKITKTTTASGTSILTDENPSSSKTEQKKLKGKALKAKKMSRTSETEVKKAISDSNEDIPSSSSIKCVDEHLTSSESEPKDEKEEILCPKPPIDCTNTDLEQSTAIETDTEQVEEKRSNRRKSRRIRNEKFKTETDTLSDHSDVKKAEKVPLETQQSDPVTAKKERNSGRLSRKEKSVINADKSEKDESPSSKSQSTERTQLLNENPSKKDKKTEQSDNTNEAGPIGKTETSNSRNTIDKKSKSSDSANHKESESIKLSSKSSPEKIMQDQDKKLYALNDGGDSDPTIRDTGEDSRKTDKEHEENNTKHEEEDYEETILNTDETKYSSEKDAENISKHFSQDSAKLKPSKAKSRNKRKKSEKKPSDSIAESDIEGALDVNAETVQATCSTSSQSYKKDMVKFGEKSEEPNLSETEIGRIRKRRQAVTIDNTKDDFQITPQNENQSIAGFNSEEQVPRPESVDSSDTPIMKIPTKTYLMCTKNKTSLLTASEDPDTVLKQQKLITTTRGDSNTVSDVLNTEALELDNANNLETSSSQDPKEQGFSDQTLTDNSDIILSCTKKSQIVVPTTPTKSSDQTNSFITPNRSPKSKRNVSKETKKSDNSFEESQKAASESSASKEQNELRTPTASCRKVRVLIKRTPTSNLPTNSRKSIFKKTSAKSKRLSKILEIMEKRPSSEQCDNKPLVSSDEINPDSDPVAGESLPVAILHDSDRDLETNEIQNEEIFEDTEVGSAEETDNKSKKKEDDHELEVNDISAASENRITDDSTKDASLNKATDSDVLQETKDELSNSLINATQDEDTPIKELPEEEVPNDKTAKDESEKQEILKDLESDNAPLEEASAPTAKAAEKVDLYIKDKSNVKSVVAEPETDVTDDEFLVQSPIPNSSETTSVTDDPEPSTSSVVKRSLRKREADSSQPDEAAKRKQRQDVEKSLTGKKKPARRRQLAEVEERASHKRSKTELEAKSTVQGKFISIIGNETIMSSTTAPIRDTKSEAASTSPSARKPAVQESKHVETTKHIILGPPGKKLLHLDSPAAEVKKPMVQTLLSSTLSLQKPSTVDDGSPLKIRKSVKKSIADENIDGDQSILSSSSVLNKNTSAVAPRKSETALKAALPKEAEFSVLDAEIEKMSKGRVHQNAVKNTKTEQPKSKTKTEVRSLEAEAAIDPMDSMNFQSDVSDIRATFSEPQGIFNMPGHMPLAISSNRSLAPTPTPDRQRNASKERFRPVSDQKKPIRESQTLSKRRARGGRNQPLVSKRKAGEAEESEDGTAVTNPKRPREMHEEDHPQQNDHVQEPAFAAFPVKITAASSVTHQVVHSTGNIVPQIVNPRKLCVKINRRPYNKWLRSTQERNIEQEGSRNVTSLPLLGEETDSAGESTAESMLQSQVESEPVIQPLPASDPDSFPAQASDVQVRESSAQLAPIAANVSPAVNDSSTSPALDITPENAQTAKTTLKTGICSLTEQHLPDDPTLLDSSKNVAEPRKLQTFQAKCLPVPIPEVKSEPEDIMDEHSPNEPMPMVAAAPATPQPHAITEDPGPLTIQVNTLGVSRPPELNSIPSAGDPDGNPNTIGQTKMFSFLYPKRYKQSYDDVGLDFCCPNLDGPMRAIDFTRLHSKAEVPVLEVPQFLVITTKFISKADKNMPSKVRAKLELLGRSKERDSCKLTPTSTTPTGDLTGPSSFSPAPTPVGPATQPFPSIIQNLLSAPIPAPSPFNHPTTVDPSTSTPVVPGSSSSTTISATLDSLSKQLPRGTTLIKKSVQQVATIPSLAGTSMVLNASPSFIQLPPICPNDKQRVELQARVQMFDLVLQTLSRRAANLSVAERQRTIEEIVRTSSLMAIDVDVGTKLLENYVHYLNKATSTMTPLTPAQINSSLGASTSSSLSKSIASSDTPQQGKKIPAAHVQQRSSLPATTMPLYDADRNTIGFPYSCSKSTAGRKSAYAANSTPVRASTSQAAAAALGKVQPRSTLGIPKSVREDASQFVNLNTTVCMPAPRTNAKKRPGTSGSLKSINSSPAVQKPALCKQKTAPARTLAKSTARAKSTASLSAVLGETPADEFLSPAGMSLSTTGNPNMFIISHAGQQEESILPDSNSSVGHMETTEIKGELDDSAEIII